MACIADVSRARNFSGRWTSCKLHLVPHPNTCWASLVAGNGHRFATCFVLPRIIERHLILFPRSDFTWSPQRDCTVVQLQPFNVQFLAIQSVVTGNGNKENRKLSHKYFCGFDCLFDLNCENILRMIVRSWCASWKQFGRVETVLFWNRQLQVPQC